jgi:hypothetical protein
LKLVDILGTEEGISARHVIRRILEIYIEVEINLGRFSIIKTNLVICLQVPHNTLNFFAQLLNALVPRIHNVRQMEIYTAEPLVPESSPSQVEIAITSLKRHKLSGIYQISAEIFQAGYER